jgi:hypothetical protein
MKGLAVLSVLCAVCLLSVGGGVAEGQRDGHPESKGATPMIVLTGFDVNDQSMDVRYKIVNRRTHDIWVCDAVYLKDSKGKDVPPYHDVYMAEDGLTLVVRKQLEVLYERSPSVPRDYAGHYVRLRAGEEQVGSLSLSLPAEQSVVLALGWPPAGGFATRMALRVGFHDEDLREKMRRIVSVAERIGGAQLTWSDFTAEEYDIYRQYFHGLWVSATFGGLAGFNDAWLEGSEEIEIPHSLTPQFVSTESCLEIVIDGVLIPLAADSFPVPYID